MLLLATADLPGARISAIELDRPGKSYMIDTLRELTSELPQSSVSPGIHRGMRADCADQPRESGSEKPHGRAMAPREAASGQRAAIVNRQSSTVNPKLFLLIGADQAIEFHSWKDWQHPLSVLVLYAVVAALDGLLLQPYIMRRTAKVPVWASILAPIVLGIVWPFWGVLLAAPLLAIVYAYKARYERKDA